MGIRGFERRLGAPGRGRVRPGLQERPAAGRARPAARAGDGRQPLGRACGAARSCPTPSPCGSRPATSSSSRASQDSLARELATPPASTPATRATCSWGRSRSSSWPTTASTPAPSRSSAAWPRATAAPGAGSLVLPTGDRFSLTDRHHHRPPPGVNLVLADPNVSRNHAEIRPQGDGFVVVDLGSTNGTRVNGVRVDDAGAAGRRRGLLRQHPACGSRPPRHAMPDQLLTLLKLFLLPLLYLFFLRVLRAVWAEVNPPEGRRGRRPSPKRDKGARASHGQPQARPARAPARGARPS